MFYDALFYELIYEVGVRVPAVSYFAEWVSFGPASSDGESCVFFNFFLRHELGHVVISC